MKSKVKSSILFTASPSSWLGACTIALTLLTAGNALAQNTWTGTTNTKWSEPTNWSTAAIPATSEVLNFGGAPTNFPTDNDIAGLTTGAINFTNNGTAGQTAVFTLGTAGQSITLSGNISTTGPSASTVNLSDTINLNLVLDANRSITANRANNLNHSITVNGEISGPFTLTKGGNASLTLTNAANSFTGLTVAGAANGLLNVSSLSDGGLPSAIGSGTEIGLNGGTLVYNGTTNASTNRAINFANTNSGIMNGGTAGVTVTLTGTFSNTTAGDKTFVLGGDNGTNTMQGNLANSVVGAGGILSLSKTGFSSWILTGNNTHTGPVAVTAGTLTVGSISDSGASNLGPGTSLLLGSGSQTGTLNYTGTSVSTARQVSIGTTVNSNGGGGASINANGAVAGTGFKFTNPDFNTTMPDFNATRTLTLAGSSPDANEINGIIKNGNTNLLTGLTKSNAGRWILSGNNSYSGPSAITAGNLNIRHANALGATTAGITVSNGSLAQLEIEGGISFAAEPLTLTSGTAGNAMFRNISGNNTWNGPITATTNATVGTLARIQSDADTLTIAGGMSGAGIENSFILQGNGNIDVTGVISGVIRVNSGSNGTGVRSLSNANIYSGVTVVGGGVLRLNNANSIPGGIGLSGGTSGITLSGGILGLGNGNFTRAVGTGADQIQLTANNTGFAAYGADRSVNLGGASASLTFGDPGFFSGITGNITLSLSAATATHTLDFENPLVLTGTRLVRVDNGSAAVDARLSGAITGTGSLSKAGAGTLEITNTGNAWGVTFIDSGTLRLGAADVLPSNAVEIKRAAGTDVAPTLDLNGFSETIGGVTLGSNTTDVNNAGQTVSIVNSAGGSAVLTLTGTFLYRAGSAGFENGQATISANLDTGASNRNLTINDGSAPVDLLISGVISGAGNGFNKAAAGTLVISGANTYTGPTAISGGILRLGANNALPDASAISLNAATLDAATFTDTAGTLDANNAAATINIGSGGALAFADSSAIDWSGGALNITGSVVSGSSIRFGTSAAGLTPAQLAQISVNGSPGSYTLDASGFLVTGPTDPYLTWAGAGVNFDADANNDGVPNGLAWLLGASGPNAAVVRPTTTQSGGNLQISFSMLNLAARSGSSLQIEHSSNLGISDPWTPVTVPEASGGPTSGITFVVTPGSPLNSVVATISSSEAASGKLFGRLKGIK